MNKLCFFTIIVAVAVTYPLSIQAAEPVNLSHDSSWIQLFNGRDLSGWTPKIVGHQAGDNFANTFRVRDGILCVDYDGYGGKFDDRFGHLYYDIPFSHYLLRVEYRIIGEQYPGGPTWGYANSGIMLHGQTPQSMGVDQFFPVSIEVQLLASDSGAVRPTANVCTPGTHIVLNGKLHTDHCTNSTSRTFPLGEWVAVELEVRGDKIIRHKVNGQTVLEYSGPQLDEKDPDAKRLIAVGAKKPLTGGTISLQSESHPVEFRKVELNQLVD